MCRICCTQKNLESGNIGSSLVISVIMGVYYHRDDLSPLEAAVQSVLEQTESSFEFLICDDGSSKKACELLERFAQADERIRLLRHGNKITLSEKLNYCLKHAKGTYIARMDDDDFSHPDRFAKQLAVLRERPELAFVGCNVALIRENVFVRYRILPERPTVQDFFMVQPYIHPTLVFRREALEAVNGYSEDKHVFLCEDYDLLLRLYAAGYFGSNLQETLFDYTIPSTAKGNRRMKHRWNESVTRWRRFRELGCLPKALPYVMKPLVVGLLPERLLKKMKEAKSKSEGVLNGT